MPNELTDSIDIGRLVGVIREVKDEMCPNCPQENCPTDGLMEVIAKLPLSRGAEAVMDVYTRSK